MAAKADQLLQLCLSRGKVMFRFKNTDKFLFSIMLALCLPSCKQVPPQLCYIEYSARVIVFYVNSSQLLDVTQAVDVPINQPVQIRFGSKDQCFPSEKEYWQLPDGSLVKNTCVIVPAQGQGSVTAKWVTEGFVDVCGQTRPTTSFDLLLRFIN